MTIKYNILRHIAMPLADKAMGTSLTRYWKVIPKMNTWSSDEIRRWQDDKFCRLVKEAYENTVYYRRVMDDVGIIPSDIKGVQDIKLFPVLTKPMVREHYDNLISSRASEIRYKKGSTGGSTGDPMKYLQSHNAWSFVNAHNIVNWEKTGYRYGDAFMALGSTSIHVGKKPSFKHSIYYSLKNKRAFSGINMTDQVMSCYLDYLRQNGIYYIYGYPSSLYLLAQYAEKHGFKGRIKCCFPTSEVLRDEFYDTIKEAFNCDILDCYGANDGSISAFALNRSKFKVGYNTFIRTLEIGADRAQSALLTDLLNNAFPLINYQIGDLYEMGIGDGYNGQVIEKIYGRTSELIEMDNGARLTGLGFATLFKDMPIEYFCIEKASGRKLACHVIPENGFSSEHSDYIIRCIQNQFGLDIDVSVDFVNERILSKSGKVVYVLDGTR